MALSANTVLEVRTGGADMNGGGFVTGASGTDYSQQDSAQFALTNGTTNGTTTIATVSATTAMIGNLVYVSGGTGSVTPGWYQITAASAGVSITVDRSTGLTAGTGVTLNIGGALASPGQSSAICAVAGQTIFLKYNATAFSLTSNTPNVSGGCVTLTLGVKIVGYDSTRTITALPANKTKVQTNVSTATQFTGSSGGGFIINLALDGNSQTASKALAGGINPYSCAFTGFNTASSGSSQNFVCCYATVNSATVFSGSQALFCVAYANTATPFSAIRSQFCISYSNTGASTDGFSFATQDTIACNSWGNGRHGFNNTGATGQFFNVFNCLSISNSGFGFVWGSTVYNGIVQNNATFGNTGGASSGTAPLSLVAGPSLTGDPFVNAGSGNFALNNTAGAGAACRAAGFPSLYPAGLTANYLDVGAAQHQDPAGGGPVQTNFRGGFLN